MTTENLIVEFVVPHYFLSLLLDYAYEQAIAGIVYTNPFGDGLVADAGMISGHQNTAGNWMITVTDEREGHIIMRTFMENVVRIVIL